MKQASGLKLLEAGGGCIPRLLRQAHTFAPYDGHELCHIHEESCEGCMDVEHHTIVEGMRLECD